jgi:thiazole synthase
MSYHIGTQRLTSRLILGTGKYQRMVEMREALIASGTEMVTVAIRRVKRDGTPEENLLNHIDRKKYAILPNTAGCFTVKDAILTAELARELLETSLIKVEVIGDPDTLFPDNEATLEAATVLVKAGFTVLPYCSDDPILCRKLEDVGCAAVMPLAAPIGSGLGIRNRHNIQLIVEQSRVPVIVDAGVGTASDAAIAMELGCTAVLMNSAIALAEDSLSMARAMRHGVEGGRLAYLAGRIPCRHLGTPSSPVEGLLGTQKEHAA